MTKAVYVGSFDPITIGHLDIIKKASGIFDELTVLVANNNKKQYSTTVAERSYLVRHALNDYGLDHVHVATNDGLTAEFMEEFGIQYLVRGMRSSKDFEEERLLERMNHEINPNIIPVYLTASPELEMVSSSFVRTLIENHSDLFKGYVAESTKNYIIENNLYRCKDVSNSVTSFTSTASNTGSSTAINPLEGDEII